MNVWDLLLNAKESKEDEDEQDIKNACLWLKAAGFPQYVQMFNDKEFPISLKLVQEDHMDFDGESLMALFRRIEILNKASEKKFQSINEKSPTSDITQTVNRKPYYEIIESDNESNNEDEENEEDEDDDDKENILEQTALSSHWSYEPRTRRWSHIDLIKTSDNQTLIEETSPKLETYLGAILPRPFVFKPYEKSLNLSNYKRPTTLPFDSFRSFEPIIELNTEINDVKVDYDYNEMMSSLKIKHEKQPVKLKLSALSPTALSPDSTLKHNSKVDRDKDKQNSHILRSASLKLIKAVSRLSPNQMSLRHKKDQKLENVVSDQKQITSSATEDVQENKLIRQMEEIDLSKLKLPDKSLGLCRESCSIADSGWCNIRTGSFIYRNGGCSEDEFKSSNKYISSDLDPVIRRLESDVDSLDDLRSKIKSKASPDSAPTSPVLRNKFNRQEIKKDHQRLSDFESYTRSDNEPAIELNEDICPDPTISSSPNIDQTLSDDNERKRPSKFNRNNLSRWSHTSYLKEKAYPQYHHILELSVNKVNILKKLSVLSCTSMLEKYCPTQKNVFNWRIPRLLPQKSKITLENSSSVFGLSLSVCQNRYGQPYPPAILNIFRYLREHGPSTQGIFRKTGMKCRIKELRKAIEKDENLNNFEGYNVNDVADILKTFFRDLPDRLLTNKLSSTLLAIYNYVPQEYQTESLKWALFSLPDENRMALDYLIEFLSYLSTFSEITKMDVKNLSLCFAPSLFNFQNEGNCNSNMSPLKLKKSNGPNSKVLAEQNAAHLCVMGMINNSTCLFQITYETLKMASHNSKDKSELKNVTQIISVDGSNNWISDQITVLKNDATNHKTGWTNINKDFIKKIHGPNIVIDQLSYRKIGSYHSNSDGVALRTWKIVIEIAAPPEYLFTNIKDKRYLWDPDVLHTEVIKEITGSLELVKFVSGNHDGSVASRQFNLLRGFQFGVSGSPHMIFSESINIDSVFTDVNSDSNQKSTDSLVGHMFCDNFVLESICTKFTRVTWISRVDLCGHHSDWYTNHWGHSLVRRLEHLKNFSDSSLSVHNESNTLKLINSPISRDKEDYCPNINFQTFNLAPETIL